MSYLRLLILRFSRHYKIEEQKKKKRKLQNAGK